MPRSAKKTDFPVSKVRRYLEPGPIVLVSSKWEGKANIMTLGWQTILEFSPALIGLMISSGNHSFQMIRSAGQCVINLPTTALTDIVVGIGNTTGSEVDKFVQFGLTAEDAVEVDAPLISECHASFECRMHDDALVDKYMFRQAGSSTARTFGIRIRAPARVVPWDFSARKDSFNPVAL